MDQCFDKVTALLVHSFPRSPRVSAALGIRHEGTSCLNMTLRHHGGVRIGVGPRVLSSSVPASSPSMIPAADTNKRKAGMQLSARMCA